MTLLCIESTVHTSVCEFSATYLAKLDQKLLSLNLGQLNAGSFLSQNRAINSTKHADSFSNHADVCSC